jgi:hypothetical protein
MTWFESVFRRPASTAPASSDSLSKSGMERRAREIILASGADTEEYFNKVVKKKGGGLTFREQAKWWLNHVQSRRRKPVALSTLELWEGCLNNWINPNVGEVPLSEVNNAVLKSLVAKMVDGGLSPKSIDTYSQVVKMVVASAVNDEGEEIYPRKWNHEFIDMPIVEEEKQNTPTFSSEVMTGLALWKKRRERMIRMRRLTITCKRLIMKKIIDGPTRKAAFQPANGHSCGRIAFEIWHTTGAPDCLKPQSNHSFRLIPSQSTCGATRIEKIPSHEEIAHHWHANVTYTSQVDDL